VVTDPHRLLILADDFTGACDAAGAFGASSGTLVVHGLPAQWPADADGVDVLGVDLDLRERSDAEAEALTRETARQLCSANPEALVLLKIDSTLRGPIAGLVAGALTGSGRKLAVIAPAFPEQGRLLRAGRVMVDGQPGASVTQALGMDGTAVLRADEARSAEQVDAAVRHAAMRGARHVVVDTDSVECLRSVAEAWQRHATEWLLVGSAGLARQVAATSASFLRHPPPSRQAADEAAAASGPVLVVAGSPAPATQIQIEPLRGLGPIVVVAPHTPRPPVPQGESNVLVLCTTPATERDSGECAQAVAETTAAWAAEFTPSAVVLAGGATARLVCELIGAHGVRLHGELAPGIPHGYLQGGQWDRVRVVTKAGGFGSPRVLLDVVHALGVSSIAKHL
jgi:uncharacterized protein YgbK (DUF1537 family)